MVLSRRRAFAPGFVLEINEFKVIFVFPAHNWDRLLAGGLVRYDGNKFVQIELDRTISGIKSLFEDSKGRFWIGSSNNGVAVMEKGKLTYWYELNGQEIGSVSDILEDVAGNIYVSARNGFYTIDSEMNLAKFNDDRLMDQNVTDLKKGDDGLIYDRQRRNEHLQ